MPERTKPPLPDVAHAFARALRGSQTDAEAQLWFQLRGSRLGGFKFRRQHPVPPYVLDFYCDSAKLAVELDGGQHGVDSEARRDQRRTAVIATQGTKIHRVWDHEVLLHIDSVLESILIQLGSRIAPASPNPHPNPSPGGRGA